MDTQTLGRYQLRREIGRGNMGIVYLAYDPVIDRAIALKAVLVPNWVTGAERERFLARFFQEVRTAGKLTHPNIVVTHDAAIDEATGTPFIAMELVEGESLAERLARKGSVPWEQAAEWGATIGRALHLAHEQGIVHRDIKPANILLTREGVPKIADFGIAKLPNAQLTQEGVVVGTPYFMSPEQLQGEPLDGRSDLFSLAGLVYTLVAGRRPFEGDEVSAVASQVLYKDPRPLSESVPGVPEVFDGVLARALSKSSRDRYLSGEEFAADLAAVLGGRPPVRPIALGERTRASVARSDVALPGEERGDDSLSLEERADDSLSLEERADDSLSLEEQTSRAPSSAPADPSRVGGRPRRRVLLASVLGPLLACLAGGVYFRDELAQQKLLFDARRDARSGNLLRSEATLEALLDAHPDLESARNLLGEVSGELVAPELPLELLARHNHRFGSCTGRLTLGSDAIEFSSKSHGWRWPFAQIRGFRARGPWGVTLQTDEEEMLGLLDGKNYDFSFLSDPLDEALSKRFGRFLEHRRDEEARSGASPPGV